MTIENYKLHLREIRGLGAGMESGSFSLVNKYIGGMMDKKRIAINRDLESGQLTADEAEELYNAIGEAIDPQ